MPSVITLTTDFGLGSHYVAQMKGVILCQNRAAVIVDISHAIAPQDVLQGALVLDQATRRFPLDAIHVAVIDPGVGTDRKLVYARIGGRRYLAPDNGLLTMLCRRERVEEIFAIENRENFPGEVSPTFHGRDILAPVAARLSTGLEPSLLGPSASSLVELDIPVPRIAPGSIEGRVLSVDSFGNLITNISGDLLTSGSSGGEVRIACGALEIRDIAKTYAERPVGDWTALVGSSGLLELAIVNGNAAAASGLAVGAPVKVTW